MLLITLLIADFGQEGSSSHITKCKQTENKMHLFHFKIICSTIIIKLFYFLIQYTIDPHKHSVGAGFLLCVCLNRSKFMRKFMIVFPLLTRPNQLDIHKTFQDTGFQVFLIHDKMSNRKLNIQSAFMKLQPSTNKLLSTLTIFQVIGVEPSPC